MKHLLSTTLLFTLMIIGITPTAGCNEQKAVDNHAAAADALYHKTARLTREYIKKTETAPDSVEVLSILDEYQEKLAKLNMSQAPLTDTYLSPGQNDTLFMLSEKLLKIVREKNKHIIVESDTVNVPAGQ